VYNNESSYLPSPTFEATTPLNCSVKELREGGLNAAMKNCSYVGIAHHQRVEASTWVRALVNTI